MDYLCELPNDSSRRRALGNLPPTLNATYERILRRVNASSKDVQLLVSRVLRWIICARAPLKPGALCEAVSIDLGDTERDDDKISDETEILRWCSSLVRQAADGGYLELAHFTVKEFLKGIGPEDNGEFSLYRIGSGHGEDDLAKVCLTYLHFPDFNDTTKNFTIHRLMNFPLRRYAVKYWYLHAHNHFHDGELFSLTKQFLHPSKPATLISWFHDFACVGHYGLVNELNALHGLVELDELYERARLDGLYEREKSAIAEASVLHLAAILAIPEICTWLIDNGCDVNRKGVFGTPLQCALMGTDVFWKDDLNPEHLPCRSTTPQRQNVIKIISEAGADLHRNLQTPKSTYSSLYVSLYYHNVPLAIRLLQEGAFIDDQCLKYLEKLLHRGFNQDLSTVIHHVERHNVHDEDVPRLLRLQIAAGKDPISSRDGENGPLQPIHSGPSLRAAAEFGQVDVITQLLRRETIYVDAADKADGITALHFAARNDHLEIVKLLQAHGAQPKRTDCDGRAAIHHAIRGNSCSCLEFFLEEASDDIPPDKYGNSLWHLAGLQFDKQILEILARFLTPIPRLNELKAKNGWSPLLCAAFTGSVECLEWLIQAGCDVMDVANDGSTALHIAVESPSYEAVRVLLAKGCDVNSRGRIGQTSLMIAAERGYVDMMDLLISNGADVEALDENGWNIVHHVCATGELRTLQFLRHTNVDWNKRGKCIIFSGRSTECSPLHLAAQNQKTEILEYLLEEGLVSDINSLTDDSVTALYIATTYDLPSAVSALLSRNADPNIRSAPDGLLPVQRAAREGKLAVIAVFLRYNCDLGDQDGDGVDCEVLAMLSGHKAAAKMFREHKVEQGKVTWLNCLVAILSWATILNSQPQQLVHLSLLKAQFLDHANCPKH